MRALKPQRTGGVLGALSAGAALVSAVLLSGVLIDVVFESWPVVTEVGLGPFLFGQTWMPVDFGAGASFGILNFIAATLLVSLIALALAFVVALGAALFLTCRTQGVLRQGLFAAVDLLAGVPSVVYGFIGLSVVVPGFLHAGVPSGQCVLAASLVLAVMLLPFLVSSLTDSLDQVRTRYRCASAALGIGDWYAACALVLPQGLRLAGPSLVAAFARGMGETMAVMMVVGNANLFPVLLGKAETIASLIALEMGTAVAESPHMHSLFAAGFVLLALVLLADVAAARIGRALAQRQDRRQTIRWCPPSWTAGLARLWASASFALVCGIVLFLFGFVFAQGAPCISWEFLTEPPAGAVLGTEGGIFPALAGSAWFTGIALALAGPLALGCALWRALFCRHPRLSKALGRLLSVGAGIPSIVLGLFAYGALVLELGLGRCVFAGSAALALMILPFMEVRMEKALREVPAPLVASAYALGCPRSYVLRTIVLPSSIGGITAALALGGCFALGAAAPLIFTGGVAFAPAPASPWQPAMALPLHLYLMLAQGTTIPQVYATAFVLMTVVLAVNGAVGLWALARRRTWNRS